MADRKAPRAPAAPCVVSRLMRRASKLGGAAVRVTLYEPGASLFQVVAFPTADEIAEGVRLAAQHRRDRGLPAMTIEQAGEQTTRGHQTPKARANGRTIEEALRALIDDLEQQAERPAAERIAFGQLRSAFGGRADG